MFVIAGATGNTGKVVAETLLSEKKHVRVIARDAAKAASLKDRGAEVVSAELDDAKGLARVLEGAEGAYLLIPPPGFTATGVLASRRKMADAIGEAVSASGVKHVVFLSSVGGQNAEGTGIIKTLHHGEQVLRGVKADVTFVRAAYFLENWFGMLQPVTTQGVLPAFFDPAKVIPMVASADIGHTAAHALLAGGQGKKVIELSGPVDLSTNDVAASFGKLLGKAIHVPVLPAEARVPALQQAGFSQEMAELFVQLDDGVDSGAVAWEGGAAHHARGKVTLEQVFAGALQAAAR